MSEQSELYSNKLYIDMTKSNSRSSRPEVFLGKGVLEKCSKFTGEHPCRSAISIKLLCNFIEILLRHGCYPLNLLYIFRTLFPRNTSGWLLLKDLSVIYCCSINFSNPLSEWCTVLECYLSCNIYCDRDITSQ